MNPLETSSNTNRKESLSLVITDPTEESFVQSHLGTPIDETNRSLTSFDPMTMSFIEDRTNQRNPFLDSSDIIHHHLSNQTDPMKSPIVDIEPHGLPMDPSSQTRKTPMKKLVDPSSQRFVHFSP
jgi:hypothetical protein